MSEDWIPPDEENPPPEASEALPIAANEGRVLPHNLDAEASVLGGILLRSAIPDEIHDRLAPEDFYHPAHREIYAAMCELAGRKAIDTITLEEELKRTGKLIAVGGLGILSELLGRVSTADNIAHHAAIVRGKARALSLIQAARGIAAKGLGDYGEVDEYLAEAKDAIDAIVCTSDMGRFRSSADRLHDEKARRQKLTARLIKYPVQFLQDLLVGVLPHDLVLLGAETGAGKTALASIIAEETAAGATGAGRRVDYFALEAEEDEIERRLKFRRTMQWLRAHFRSQFGDVAGEREFGRRFAGIGYRGWYLGQVDEALPPGAEEQIEAEVADETRTLRTLYRGSGFSRRDLVGQLSREADLIVVDHLHYVDGEDEENENRSQKRLIMALRDRALALGVPVIAIAHLRKKASHRPPLVPMIDDFMGSSDIAKNVTQAIVLAPAWGQKASQPYHWRTYAAVRKDRMDGAKPWVGLLTYDARTGRYERPYRVGRLTGAGEEWKPTPAEEMPPWASHFAQVAAPKTQEGTTDA